MAMAIKRVQSSMSVVDAAVIRILNTFKQGVKVYLAFSAGKDSLCLSHMVYSLIKQGKIDPKQLTVFFIDEEAIYPSMEQMAFQWHGLFSNLGVKFDWYCLPFKQVSCFHQLQNDERWITWEPGKEDCWVRDAPPFAIRTHPAVHYPGEMNYQHFCTIVMNDGIMLMGVRASESVQRLRNIARSKMNGGATGQQFTVLPMYDWKDTDVWLYIKEHKLKFPESYMDLYRDGLNRPQMRLSNFFGADSCNGLRHIAATNPDLWDRIERREPNAYMVMLYWDSELFKRSTRKRQKMEENGPKKDYKALVKAMLFDDFDKTFLSPERKSVGKSYRQMWIKMNGTGSEKIYKKMYEAIIAGDPKRRTLRAIIGNWAADCVDNAKKDAARREVKRRG